MMMVAAGRNKRRLIPEPHHLIEPEDAFIKRQRAVDIGDFQVHVADGGS
jgi:hypothetical protein